MKKMVRQLVVEDDYKQLCSMEAIHIRRKTVVPNAIHSTNIQPQCSIFQLQENRAQLGTALGTKRLKLETSDRLDFFVTRVTRSCRSTHSLQLACLVACPPPKYV